MKKWILYSFASLVFLALLTPLWVFKDLLFPYITSKAFFFRIVIEAALPLYAYLLTADKKLRPQLKNPLNIAVLIFLLINIISSFTGVNTSRSLWGNFERMGGVYYLFHLVTLYFYVQLLAQAGGEYLKRFLQAFIIVAVLVTINGIIGWMGVSGLVLDPSLPTRVSSTFGNPIFFASYLIFPMFLAAYFAVQEEKIVVKVLYWTAVFLQVVGVYSSGTRGATVGIIIACFLAALLYLILTKNSNIRRYGFIAIGVFVVLAGTLIANHSRLPAGTTLSRLANLRDSNTESRLIQWRMALEGAKKNPLLGVGAENYYVISDAYYNPELYKYDRSWFDKPHNFILEVLVTNGLLGLLAYFGMFVFSIYGIWKAYRENLLGLVEACIFFAALIAYQVQNIFVFDTVSASVAFYAFLGFTIYLWRESVTIPQSLPVKHNNFNLVAPSIVLGVSAVLMLYIQYASNIASLKIAKRVNYGLAYTQQDPRRAAEYFESALSYPFNLDPRETANRYSDFAVRLSHTAVSPELTSFVLEQLDKSVANQLIITEKTNNDPLLWMRLAIGEMAQALAKNQQVDASKSAVEKAISLAPKRVELLQLKMQYDGNKKDWADAVTVAQTIVNLNPVDPQLRWQLAMAYYLNSQIEEAIRVGDDSIVKGVSFTQLQQFAWYIQYYQSKNDYLKVIPLLERAVTLQPNEIGLYVELAKSYAGVGDNDHATALAKQVINSNPSQKAAMEVFITSLGKK